MSDTKIENTYYCNLKMRDVANNKNFWRKVKPLILEKVNLRTKILLLEKENDLSDSEISSKVEKVISDGSEIPETFKEFFVNLVPSLIISPTKHM